jgi:pimeloyl-ACP methyl ester carboxylesterase
MWDEVAARIEAAGHPVYALDVRGHGDSDLPDDGYDNETVVADLVTVCRELRLTGVLIAGHSWGGNIAVRVAAEHPELAAGLALVDGGWAGLLETSFADLTWEKGVEMAGMWRPDVTGATEETMRELLRALHPNWSDVSVEASLADMVKGPDGLLAQRLPMDHYLSIAFSMLNDPPARWYPGVKVPVLLLAALPPSTGSWATLVRKWVADAEATLPQADARWYADADHNLHADQPDRVAGDLLDLARIVNTASSERS